MKAFLKRWHAEFKKDREIRQSTLLPTMSIEAYVNTFGDLNQEPASKNPLSYFKGGGGEWRDDAGNPDPNGPWFY